MVLTLHDLQEKFGGEGLVLFRDAIPYKNLDQRLQMKKNNNIKNHTISKS